MEMKKWRCTICGEEFEGENPPEVCPVCNVGSEFFEEVKAEEKTTPSINRDEKKKVISGKAWKCTVCDEIFPDGEVPDTCPVCGVGKELFEEIEIKPVSETSWKCTVCSEVIDGEECPAVCPVCGAGKEAFIKIENKKEENLNKEEKVIIIGGGVAAVSAADAVRSKNKLADIQIIGKESVMPYYRTMLTEHLYADMPEEKLKIKKDKWYEEKNIKITIGDAVKSVSAKDKKVTLESGKEYLYDKLILATGSECFIPPIKSASLDGVFTIRSMKDTENVKEYVKKCKRAVVIGGGVLGLEAAWGLKELGMEVSVIEMMQRILPRQLDEKGSKILEQAIVRSGVKVYKGVVVDHLEGEGKVSSVVLEKGEHIMADLVVISAGILPNKQLAVDMGLQTGRGIIVNEKMETSEKDIYACGDAAEYEGKVIGLWQIAMEQGKTAGINASGDSAVYKEQIQPLNFDGMNIKLISIGLIGNGKECEEFIEDIDTKKSIYKKLYFEENKLKGAILIGDVSKGITIIKSVRESAEKNVVLGKIYS